MDGDYTLDAYDETYGAEPASPRDLAAQREALDRTRARMAALQPTTEFARAFATAPEHGAEEPPAGGGGAGPAPAPEGGAYAPPSDSLEEEDLLAEQLGPLAADRGAFRTNGLYLRKTNTMLEFCSDTRDTKGGNTRSPGFPPLSHPQLLLLHGYIHLTPRRRAQER